MRFFFFFAIDGRDILGSVLLDFAGMVKVLQFDLFRKVDQNMILSNHIIASAGFFFLCKEIESVICSMHQNKE